MELLQNKYLKWYYIIIERARNRVIEKPYEKHHIIPKSLGGTNDLSNIVNLTPREHLIAHLLLVKFTQGLNRNKMWFAVNLMANCNGVKINSRLYEVVKKEYSEVARLTNKTKIYKPHSLEARIKISKAGRGKPKSEKMRTKLSASRKGIMLSAETKAKISLARKGKPQSPETVAKRVAAQTGKKRSLETREKMRIARSRISLENVKAANRARKGILKSPECKAKIRESLKLYNSLKREKELNILNNR